MMVVSSMSFWLVSLTEHRVYLDRFSLPKCFDSNIGSFSVPWPYVHYRQSGCLSLLIHHQSILALDELSLTAIMMYYLQPTK